MHYYQHHIGDFIKSTSRLTDSQVMAYLRLIWLYYDNDGVVENDPEQLAFEIGSDTKTVSLIIKTYFQIDGNRIRQSRCDKELNGYLNKSNGGKLGAERRWGLRNIDGLPMANPMPPQCDPNANQEPRTNNQEPITKLNPITGETKFPPCPYENLISLWGKHLPHLSQPRSWEGSRKTNMKQRWIQASKKSQYSPDGYSTLSDGIDWWDSFFEYIASDTKLSHGFESAGRTWKPDLEWVMNATNFQKIIDGKYNK